jgi:hypothetical protein
MSPVRYKTGDMSKHNTLVAKHRPKLIAGEAGWHKGRGVVRYDPHRTNKRNTTGWLVVEVDREITRLFRWFIDRELINMTGAEDHGILQPSWDAHISILRGENDLRPVPKHHREALWGKYEGMIVEFLYSPVVKMAKGEFFFVDVKSEFLLDLRREEFDLPYDFGLHLTVARMRDHWTGPRDDRFKSGHWNGR